MADSRFRDQVSVEDLATFRRADPDVALHTRVRQVGGWSLGAKLGRRVAPDAELRLPHGAQAKTMLVVVTRGTETTTERARGRITDEAAAIR